MCEWNGQVFSCKRTRTSAAAAVLDWAACTWPQTEQSCGLVHTCYCLSCDLHSHIRVTSQTGRSNGWFILESLPKAHCDQPNTKETTAGRWPTSERQPKQRHSRNRHIFRSSFPMFRIWCHNSRKNTKSSDQNQTVFVPLKLFVKVKKFLTPRKSKLEHIMQYPVKRMSLFLYNMLWQGGVFPHARKTARERNLRFLLKQSH